MAYEQKNNTGTLFKNKDKKEDRHPSMKGSMTVEGKEYWVSSWTNKDKNGDVYISFTCQPKEKK